MARCLQEMGLSEGVTEMSSQAEVDKKNAIRCIAQANEEISWLDITVDEVACVEAFKTREL